MEKYNGKTYEELTTWEKFKLGLQIQGAIAETALTNRVPWPGGFMRGDIYRKWTGAETIRAETKKDE